MKALEAGLLPFLKKASQLVIPIYQRTYSWDDKQCQQLWDDIVRAGESDSVRIHFVGSVVYVQDGVAGIMDSSWLVIDGQQRMTTVTLLLEALARAVGESEPLEGFTSRKIRNYYLTNPEESGEKRYKLILSETDKNTLQRLVDGREVSDLPDDKSIRILENYEFFTRRLIEFSDRLEVVCKGLSKLAIVDISLNREYDNPQLIFESMNSTGKALSQADLIRNFMLMGLEQGLQTRLYEDHWRPMEKDFGQEAYGKHFDSFMRHYLTVKTGSIPRIDDVYEAFKVFALDGNHVVEDPASILKDIQDYSKYYCRLALGKEPSIKLRSRLQDLIVELRYTVAMPLLLELYHDYATTGLLTEDEFGEVIDLIESYVFRRQVVQIPTNSLNKTFAEFKRHIDKSKYVESIKAHLLLLPSYRRFPSDDEFDRALLARDMYNTPNRAYWLRKLENHNRRELVAVEDYTIEHIMPQNPNLSEEWTDALGPDWKNIQNKYLHTIGNLTLTAYNSQYSDKPFAAKRDMEDVGFHASPLFLNRGLGIVEIWNEEEILKRANRLAGQANEVWPLVTLPAGVIDTYRPAEVSHQSRYNLDDHEYLRRPEVLELFELLRTQLLQIDPCVNEEILKLYIAYKAETNFVDIVPQASGLLLSVNLPFNEIEDPRGLARDVTNLSRWGNGDIEIKFTTPDELGYVMTFARQAFDKQMVKETD